MSTVIDGSASVTINNGAVLGITSGTAVASTSGTSIDFTSIPSWVKRVTVMFNGVSTNGTSSPQIQVGSGSVLTSGYNASAGLVTNTSFTSASNFSTGFPLVTTGSGVATATYYGQIILSTMGSNIWQGFGNVTPFATAPLMLWMAGGVTLSGALDRVRLTTVNGTDTFDSGSVNIMYEG